MPTGTLKLAQDEWHEFIPAIATPFTFQNKGAALITLFPSATKPVTKGADVDGIQFAMAKGQVNVKINELFPGAGATDKVWIHSIMPVAAFRSHA